jgi:hypothetical protein
MSAWSLDTLKQGIRLLAPWVLLVLGVLVGWTGLRLAILALGEWDSQAPALIQSTALLAGVLTALWICARLLDEDRRSGLCVAADGTAPGPEGRLLGRWAGAALLGLAVCTLTGLALQLLATGSLSAPIPGLPPLWLHSTNIATLGLAAAWGVLLTGLLRGAGTLAVGGLLWGAAHLPWGAPGLLAGRAGAALGILLPGPRPPGPPTTTWLPATLAATVALLLAATLAGGLRSQRR